MRSESKWENADGLDKLLNYSSHKLSEFEEASHINVINEQFQLIQREDDQSQHSFEIMIDAFIHAGQETL
jgi:hypothetical protein